MPAGPLPASVARCQRRLSRIASTMASYTCVFSYTPESNSLPGPIAVTRTSSAVWLAVVQSTTNLLSVPGALNGLSSDVRPSPLSLGR